MPNRNNRARSARTSKLYDQLERTFRENIGLVHRAEDLVEFCLNNIPQVPWLLEHEAQHKTLDYAEQQASQIPRLDIRQGFSPYLSGTLEFSFHNLPYEQMLIHIAGPIHRRYRCLWELNPWDSMLTLSSKVKVRDQGKRVKLDLDCWLNNTEQCQIIPETSTYESTTTSYRVKCS